MAGDIFDVRLSTRIEALERRLRPADTDALCIDAQHGALLPGLHDHHIHLRAAAAAQQSLDCSVFRPGEGAKLQHALQQFGGQGWIRAVGYHESIAGDLDGFALDKLCAHRPVRLQHSSGKLWVLNSMALQQLDLQAEAAEAGIERDEQGRPTGRLWRMDAWLRRRLPPAAMTDLQALSRQLASYGVTGVTDASYSNDDASAQEFASARQRRELLQRIVLMGGESLARGDLKIMLDEDDLPELQELAARITRAHSAGRGVAFHCVSHVELLMALSAMEIAAVPVPVRIEHGGVVRPEVIPRLRSCGATVVTQPGFLAQRGERLSRQAAPQDVAYLYPYASLLAAGVPIAASSDAPYGPLNPWQIMAAAVTRQSETGRALGRRECVPAREALRGYLSRPDNPGGAPRTVSVGLPADLCLLDRPLGVALQNIGGVQVRHTWVDGEEVYDSSANTSSVCSPR